MTLEDGLVRVLSSKIAASTPAALLIANYLRILPSIDWSDERAPGTTAAYAALTAAIEIISIHMTSRSRAAMRNGITPEYLDSIIEDKTPLEEDYLWKKTKGGFYDVTYQAGKRAKLLQERFEESPTLVLQHNLIQELIWDGRGDDALDFLYTTTTPKQLSNSITSHITPRCVEKHNYLMTVGENIHFHEKFLKHPTAKNFKSFGKKTLMAAMDYQALGFEEQSDQMWQILTQVLSADASVTTLYSHHLQRQDKDKEAQSMLEESVRRILTEERYSLEPIRSTKNPAFKVVDQQSNWLNRLLILKGSDDYDSLKTEMDNSTQLAQRLDSNIYCTTTPLGIVENKIDDSLPKFLYVMERDRGDSLMTVLEEGRPDANLQLARAVDFLAYYHAETPIQAEPLNYKDSLESRLFANLHERVKSSVKTVVKHLNPLITDLNRTATVANKDAHPNNFRVTPDGRLMIIDTEKSYGTSQLIDVANLLEYSGTLSFQEKMDSLDSYVEEFNSHSEKKIEMGPELRRKYLNAVIYRSLSYLGYLESKPSEVKYELNWVESGLDAINRLKDDFKKYYDNHQWDYTVLQSFLSRMHAALEGRISKNESPSTVLPGRILPGQS